MRRIALALVLRMAGMPAMAQTPAGQKPQFEIASVKPCAPGDGTGRGVPGQRGAAGGGGSVIPSPGRLFVNCMSVSSMINIYLTVSDAERLINDSSRLIGDDQRRVRGGPGWVYSDRYTINAETSDRAAAGPTGGPIPDTLLLGPMLRLLLEDRFQLKTHRDTEEVTMYSLTIAKGGLKIKPMEEGGCVPFDLSTGRRPWEVFKPGEKPLCSQGTGVAESDWTIYGAGQAMSNLAGMLTTVTGRHVFDKTGLSGRFNYNLRFAHDDTTPGEFPPGMPSPFPQSDVPAGRSLFTVLEEQLGLKLVPDKGPRGYLVIDRVERPSEN